MNCPKCKAKIGIMKHEVMLDTGVVSCTRCIMCGYWSQPYTNERRHHKAKRQTVS